MLRTPTFYARPEGSASKMDVSPRLASWNAAGHPDQLRLAEALDEAETALAQDLVDVSRPLALRLDVGLPASADLLNEHDLDNYLFPLATRLTKRPGLSLVSVWGTKQQSADSTIRLGPAVASDDPVCALRREVRTTASASTAAYKQQIADQLAGATELCPGPVKLELAFAVGPRRNWLNLWKPSIDALGQLLGRSVPPREWHPQDGRITELALHCTIDESLGDQVAFDVAATVLGG